jgi:hypothetical protein
LIILITFAEELKVMKFPIMQLSAISCDFIPLQSKYSLQRNL